MVLPVAGSTIGPPIAWPWTPFQPIGTVAAREMTGMPRASRRGLALLGSTTAPLAGVVFIAIVVCEPVVMPVSVVVLVVVVVSGGVATSPLAPLFMLVPVSPVVES